MDKKKHDILIIKPGAIGDLLQLTPVVRALAAAYPGANISLLVGSRATATLFRHNPHVAETLVFDRRGGHRSLASMLKLWSDLRRRKYGLVINFQRSNLKTWFLAASALPCRVLVYHKSRDRTVHVVDNYLDTLSPLGIAGQDRGLELHVGRADLQFAEETFSANGLGEKLVIALNPGASHPVNRWGAGRFAALADTLAGRLSAKIVLVGGTEDTGLAEQIMATAESRPLDLTGKTDLLQLGAILKKCELLVSGDTGPLHLATSVGTRVLALFGAADPARSGPVGTGHRVIQAQGVACLPCRSRACAGERRLECMNALSVREVADAVVDMAGKTKSSPV